MAQLADNRWGKSRVRVSKVHRGRGVDDFSDVTVQIFLEGDVELAHTTGDNTSVLPTDTMRNTVYGLAQEHLTKDLEGFGQVLVDHFLAKEGITQVTASLSEARWTRVTDTGFIGGNSEQRTSTVAQGATSNGTWAGIDGLVVLKTQGSAFKGFPEDEFTILPPTDDRILATSVMAEWAYAVVPPDTTATWNLVRAEVVDRFFGDWSASVQHQGWLMAESILGAVPEISEITFRLPNQHHLPFDLTRFDIEDHGIVFQPVSEPYGDIGFTATRD